jgi:hypothetical protein
MSNTATTYVRELNLEKLKLFKTLTYSSPSNPICTRTQAFIDVLPYTFRRLQETLGDDFCLSILASFPGEAG